MPIHEWSEAIMVLELNDEPAFSDDVAAAIRRLEALDDGMPDVVTNLQGVSYINSSNIAQLLRLRKFLVNAGSRMRVCSVNDTVWSVFMTTGLDKVFEFTDDVSTSLASLQIGELGDID